MYAQLRADGEKHSRKRIARLMRMVGLVGGQERTVIQGLPPVAGAVANVGNLGFAE